MKKQQAWNTVLFISFSVCFSTVHDTCLPGDEYGFQMLGLLLCVCPHIHWHVGMYAAGYQMSAAAPQFYACVFMYFNLWELIQTFVPLKDSPLLCSL